MQACNPSLWEAVAGNPGAQSVPDDIVRLRPANFVTCIQPHNGRREPTPKTCPLAYTNTVTCMHAPPLTHKRTEQCTLMIKM